MMMIMAAATEGNKSGMRVIVTYGTTSGSGCNATYCHYHSLLHGYTVTVTVISAALGTQYTLNYMLAEVVNRE